MKGGGGEIEVSDNVGGRGVGPYYVSTHTNKISRGARLSKRGGGGKCPSPPPPPPNCTPALVPHDYCVNVKSTKVQTSPVLETLSPLSLPTAAIYMYMYPIFVA